MSAHSIDANQQPARDPAASPPGVNWQALAARTQENFHVLTPLLPKLYQDDFRAVYAFCRIADDIADAHTSTPPTPADRADAHAALADLRTRAARGLAGSFDNQDPLNSLWTALHRIAATRPLKARHLHDLIDAFQRDQHQRYYATWPDLLSYCRKSADPVGRMVLALGDIDDEDPAHADRVRMSDATCTALQLVNHIQDLRRDLLERDRVYLPSAELPFPPHTLRDMADQPEDHRRRAALIKSIRPMLDRAQDLFVTGAPLPKALRGTAAAPIERPIRLFNSAGAALCAKIRKTGCTTLYARPSLSYSARAAILARACVS